MTILPFNLLDFLVINEKSKKKEIVKKVTVSEFLKFAEANPNERFELLNGKIIPMANVKPNHGKITSNFNRILGNHLLSNNSPCFAFQDIVCKIDDYNAPHPDIVIVCNDTIDNADCLAYPTVVGEVYSSNRNDDKEKLVRYQNCSSIQEILMIEQKKIEVAVYKRNENNWICSIHYENDTIVLDSINFSFSINELYQRVTFKKKGNGKIFIFIRNEKNPSLFRLGFCLYEFLSKTLYQKTLYFVHIFRIIKRIFDIKKIRLNKRIFLAKLLDINNKYSLSYIKQKWVCGVVGATQHGTKFASLDTYNQTTTTNLVLLVV